MKKFISLILAFLLCFSFSVSAFADVGFVDKPVVSNPVDVTVAPSNKELSEYYEQILDWASKQSDYLDEVVNAELSYFFTVLVNDSYGVSTGNYNLPDGTTYSGTAYLIRATRFNGLLNELLDMFNPDYLHAYFDIFKRCMNDYSGCDFMASAVGYSYAPNTNSAIAYTSPLYPVSYDFDSFSDYYNTLYAKYLSEKGSNEISVGYESKNPDSYKQPINIPVSDFKQYIDNTDQEYYLKNRDQNIISFRNNVRDFGFIDCFGVYENRYFRVSFLDDGALKEYSFYITPFCDIDGKRYTSENTFRFFTKSEIDEEGFSVQNLYVEMYLLDNGEFILSGEPQVIASEYGVVRYVELLFGFTSTSDLHFHSYNYKLYKDFMSSTARTDSTYNPDQLVVTFDPAYSSLRLYNSYPDDYVNIFDHVYHYNASNCVLSSHNCSYEYCDLGFVRTDELPAFSYSIDTTKIPDNYYITVSGDTIYDYSITNPETGQSSTINEYITNNYTYITNDPGGDGGGSGTTGGSVSVGGNVGVNGNVNVGGEVKLGGEVKVNVNVSGAGESGNGVGDPPEIGAVDDLVDYLPEKSPVINEYLKIFFDTLPPELLGLILAGVAVAIIKLIFRR